MTWLVTGGAGYIGAHVVAAMREAGDDVVVLDDLSTGERSRIGDVPFGLGSVLDEDLVRRLLREHRVRGIVHLAAKKQVAESVERPLLYYRQNVEGMRVLLDAALACDVEWFVFSSSAAVYGSSDVVAVTEESDCCPLTPYGVSKLIGERMLADVAAVSGLRYASLRYFNVAGAGSPQLSERGISNLIPMVFRELEHRRPPRIFGSDYPTPDGTCVRDFVHVADVASAHVAAAKALACGSVTGLTANVGRGEGISVREIVELILRLTGTADQEWARPLICPRRPGDTARVVAAAESIRTVLGWEARCSVEQIIASARPR